MIVSPLATYTIQTANRSPRYAPVGSVIVHYMADDGHFTGKGCADYFYQMGLSGARQASSNYCIGGGGDVACSVPEDYRAWTSGSEYADQRAITIEVSCISNATGEITAKAWEALVALLADIGTRYSIRYVYTGDSSGTLLEHRMFQYTDCPGEWLHRNMSRLAAESNAAMDAVQAPAVLGWVWENGAWHYYNELGLVWDEWIRDDKNQSLYYVKSTGDMAQKEWLELDGKWYYFGSDGVMVTGWLQLDGSWYYLKRSGQMARSEWIWDPVYGAWYYLNAKGVMQRSSWISWHGDWYWVKANGRMASGEWVKDGDKLYYCYGNGRMARNEEVDGYTVGSDGTRL